MIHKSGNRTRPIFQPFFSFSRGLLPGQRRSESQIQPRIRPPRPRSCHPRLRLLIPSELPVRAMKIPEKISKLKCRDRSVSRFRDPLFSPVPFEGRLQFCWKGGAGNINVKIRSKWRRECPRTRKRSEQNAKPCSEQTSNRWNGDEKIKKEMTQEEKAISRKLDQIFNVPAFSRRKEILFSLSLSTR